MNLLRLAIVRQTTYQLLGTTLLYPDASAIQEASEAAAELLEQKELVSSVAYYQPWQRFLEGLTLLTVTDLPRLRREYASLFGVGARINSIPLCESGYLGPDAGQSAEMMSDLERTYAERSLSVSCDEGQTPDHAAVELEYMSLLCEVESEAWRLEDIFVVREVMSLQVEFLQRHPCCWFPLLFRALGSTGTDSLYYSATETAYAMTVHDASFLDLIINSLQEPVSESLARETVN